MIYFPFPQSAYVGFTWYMCGRGNGIGAAGNGGWFHEPALSRCGNCSIRTHFTEPALAQSGVTLSCPALNQVRRTPACSIRRRHALSSGWMGFAEEARHARCKPSCHAQPTCRLNLRPGACRPFYLALVISRRWRDRLRRAGCDCLHECCCRLGCK
jgi:hypothetical protein